MGARRRHLKDFLCLSFEIDMLWIHDQRSKISDTNLSFSGFLRERPSRDSSLTNRGTFLTI